MPRSFGKSVILIVRSTDFLRHNSRMKTVGQMCWRKGFLPMMATGILVGMAGCSEAPQEAGATAPTSTEIAQKDAEAKSLFAKLDAELTKLQDQLANLGPNAQEQAEMTLSELRVKRDELMKNYNSDELKQALVAAQESVTKWSEEAKKAIAAANAKLGAAASQVQAEAQEHGVQLTNPFDTKPATENAE